MILRFTPVFFFIFLFPVHEKENVTGKAEPLSSHMLHLKAMKTVDFFKFPDPHSMPDIDKLKESDWYSSAAKSLEEREYYFNKTEDGNSYSTPNRKNNLRFYYDENGFTAEPRTTRIPVANYDKSADPDEIKYRQIPAWKVAFQLDKKQIGKGVWETDGNKAAYRTDNVIVEYINNEEGMRQNFIVQKSLSGDKDLELNFSVKTTLEQHFSSNRLRFVHKKSGVVLDYEQLKVWDADGRLLAAAFEKHADDYCIRVNAAGAAYPITIDPLSAIPSAYIESDQANARLGKSVAGAGDINGDGYCDVIVGAYEYDNGQADEGAAFIYYGSATGINSTAGAVLQSNQANALMGFSVGGGGDINGDGYSDVIAGANLYDNGQVDEGAAFVYYGSAAGINTTPVILESNQAGAGMGYSVANAGDINGDGYSDMIAGVYLYDNGETDEGAAFIYYGSAAGLNTTAAVFESNRAGAGMGYSVAGAGDINGDGYNDVVAGAPTYSNSQTREGAAFICYGSASGLNTAVVAILECNQAQALGGYSVSCAGDVNGDGYSDIIAGIPYYDNGQTDEGAAFIYHGSAAGINTVAAAILESNQADAQMGISVACAGDINGDGYGDVITGVPYFDHSFVNEGAFFIYHGSGAGINAAAVTTAVYGDQSNETFGISIAGAGDVNGDGYSDVIAGAYTYDGGQTDEGAAFVYHGSGNTINMIPGAVMESNQGNSYMGISVAGAGDINGDGYADVIAGACFYDNGQTDEGAVFIYYGSASGINTAATILESNKGGAQMGWSVASAGDVNTDGYSDVIVGARTYSNGQAGEGAFFIYHGSAAGITTTAAAVVESNQANAALGYSVSCAGDVNGDGYSDVIAGARTYDNGQSDEGAAFIYHGSATGINTTVATIIESNQANAQMGYSVSGAGDVNGDGYDDVIAGAYSYDNGQPDEGAAFIYHGSATGINTTAAAILECNQTGAQMGCSVSGAGDINGDGYSDVIVGADFYDNGALTEEGAVFIYHGSASGTGNIPAAMREGGAPNIRMGISVACAGDVNGDGYSDVITGAYLFDDGQADEGAAFIYKGSAGGISGTFTALTESNQVNAQMGWSVVGAGDINGDGYSDVIVGAHLYDNGQTDEGAAFVYLGNAAADNKRNNLKLYNTNLVTPLSSGNFNRPNFGAGLFAKSFLGRNKGKLVWETKVSYQPYSGIPITNSVLYTSQQNTYTDLTTNGTELKNLVTKQPGMYTKIRARVKYDPVTALTGQIYGPWRYAPGDVAGALSVVPVELVSFTAVWKQPGKTAEISFTAGNETNMCCYDIEKSTDGFSFDKTGHVNAVNASSPHDYSFTDHNATGKKQYYRLKMIRNTGETEYSNIQSLQNKTATEILVFPNPAADVLQLQLNNVYKKINVQIVNSAGQTMKQFSDLTVLNQTVIIPLNDLVHGAYFLYLRAGEEKQVLQFIKE